MFFARLLARLKGMSVNAQPPAAQWPLRPDAKPPRREWADEFLDLQRQPSKGKISGLSLTVSNWLQVDPLLIRALFVITALSSGFGLFAYGAGWALTTDSHTGSAPLDRFGSGWRRHSARTVVGWSVALFAIAAVSVAGATGGSWLALGLIAATAWLGWRARYRPGKYLHPTPLPAAPKPTVSTSTKKRSSTVPAALITLSVAFLAGVSAYETLPWQPWIGFVLALFIIGLGLILTGLRGLSVLLVIAGLLTSLGLGGVLAAGPPPPSQPTQYFQLLEQADLADRNLTDTTVTLDLTAVDVITDQTWRVNTHNSWVDFELPASENIHIQIDATDSLVGIPDGIHLDDSVYLHSQVSNPDAATLTILVEATGSEVWVIEP